MAKLTPKRPAQVLRIKDFFPTNPIPQHTWIQRMRDMFGMGDVPPSAPSEKILYYTGKNSHADR